MHGGEPSRVPGLATDLETIINWIAHPFELSELILKPEYLQ